MAPRFPFTVGVLLLALLLCAAAPPEVAVVLESYAPGAAHPDAAVGEVLAAGRQLTVPPDAELVLIDHVGRKIVVRGPWRGSVDTLVAPPGRDGPGIGFAALGQSLRDEAFAGVRSASLGDPWTIDLGRGEGAVCYQRNGALRLMRTASGRKDRLSLTADAGQSAEVAWDAQRRVAAWPEALGRQDGLHLSGRFAADGRRIELTLHEVPDGLPTPAHRAAWMAAQGCASQARLLVLSAAIDTLVEAKIQR